MWTEITLWIRWWRLYLTGSCRSCGLRIEWILDTEPSQNIVDGCFFGATRPMYSCLRWQSSTFLKVLIAS